MSRTVIFQAQAWNMILNCPNENKLSYIDINEPRRMTKGFKIFKAKASIQAKWNIMWPFFFQNNNLVTLPQCGAQLLWPSQSQL